MKDEAEQSNPSAGSVCEPVAWLVTGDGYEYATLLKEHAEVIAEEEDGVVVPLYLSPTLTDAEREAIGVALQSLQENYRGCNQQEIDTLRSLLRRVE